jgi:hypothetical protein
VNEAWAERAGKINSMIRQQKQPPMSQLQSRIKDCAPRSRFACPNSVSLLTLALLGKAWNPAASPSK